VRTSKPSPVHRGERPGAVTLAIGSHTPTAREVDTSLVTRSQVVAESRRSALREAGDLLIPIGKGAFSAADLVPLADLVHGERSRDLARPRLFKSTGMPWQDLVTAAAVVEVLRSDEAALESTTNRST
jgi:ornithine cyclodeaminase/alanine dehydrogenase-like protein (mu-crystallin family)